MRYDNDKQVESFYPVHITIRQTNDRFCHGHLQTMRLQSYRNISKVFKSEIACKQQLAYNHRLTEAFTTRLLETYLTIYNDKYHHAFLINELQK